MGLFGKKHSIGKTIAELRKAKGWTQIELAEKLQVSDKAISKWEKDSGAPSIEFFPALAELFDVSIDYLMTGKETEPEIITMSKIELCAKNDDISMLEEIKGYNITDENGKSLQDYIIQYKSVNIYNKTCDLLKLPLLEDIKMALLSNNVSRLEKIQIKKYAHIDDRKKLPSHLGSLAIITDEILDMIVDDEKVNSTTFDYIISPNKQTNNVWYWVFPWLIDLAYKSGNVDKFDKLINAAKQNNQYGFEHKASDDNCHRYNNINIGSHYQEKMFGIVVIKKSTFEQALSKSDIEAVEILNAINNQPFPLQLEYRYRANEDEIRVAKLKLDKTITQEELAIQSTIHSGIICIDELLALKNFKIIKKALNTYPIHLIEQYNAHFQQKEWRTLFQNAVDNSDNALADIIIKGKQEDIEAQLLSYWSNSKAERFNFNKKHLYILENGRKVDLIAPTYGTIIRNRPKTLEEAIAKLQMVKQRIIDELSLKPDKEKTIGDLTKQYFECELAKGNIDMVVIKLCVRLEAVLRCDYHYEGDLSVMIDKYCSRFNTYDDEGNDYDPYTPKVLNKLRMKRNNIVHSEKNSVDLTLEELQYCIDYICKMG